MATGDLPGDLSMPQMKVQQDLAAQIVDMDKSYARLFNSELGQYVLADMKKRTIESRTYYASPGFEGVITGIARSGANDWMLEMLSRYKRLTAWVLRYSNEPTGGICSSAV